LPQTEPIGDPFETFRDQDLDRLLQKTVINNQDLAAALAHIDQARATLGLARADQNPSLVSDFAADQNLDSRNSQFDRSGGGAYRQFNAQLTLDYEIDLWGRIRRSVNQAEANLSASEADYRVALLSLKAEVARNYLTLRSLDREIELLDQTSSLRQQRLELTRAREEAGTSSGLDVSRATTEYESTRAEVARLAQRRGELENALATLTGEPASTFALPSEVKDPRIPSIPTGVPSDLLRRRPDIAAAERRLAAASEGIGIAIATYLPRISLTGVGGVNSAETADLFDPKSTFYTMGPSLFIPIFQGGRADNDKARARAQYREALASYRQTLLAAIRETENALLGTRTLDQALTSQSRATDASAKTARLSRARFEGGLDSLFEVTETERQTLEQERLLTQTRLARQLATVNLIQALGGEVKGTK
jgi:multidrug efflux system outer membrane protein